MKNKLLQNGRALCVLALSLAASDPTVAGETFAIEPIEKGFTIRDQPSLSLYWQGQQPKALLIFIPGGAGYIGLRSGQTGHRYAFFRMLESLSDPKLTQGRMDVALLDSPGPMSPGQWFPSARGAKDHLVRIASAVRFYKEKTGLPIWLMGHSNGGISLTEYVKYARDQGTLAQLGGLIMSGGRNESDLTAPLGIPVLFLHHSEDGCSFTKTSASLALFERVKTFNTAPTRYNFVTESVSMMGDPCESGRHMYHGGEKQAAQLIQDFVLNPAP